MMKKVTLISGKTGTNKTKGYLFKMANEIIAREENILFLDSKEEYYNEYSSVLKEKGYDIVVLNLKEPNKGNTYNPYTLPYIYYKKDVDKSFELLQKISYALCRDEKQTSDPFWEYMSSDLVTGLSMILFKEASEDKINLGSVNVGINLCSSDSILMKNYLNNLDINSPIYACTSGTLFAPSDTRGSIISVVKQRFSPYCIQPNLMNMLSETNFDIKSLGDKKTAIFVIARDDNPVINNIANIFIEQIMSLVIFEKKHFNFILDNIDTINRLNCLNNVIDMQSEYIRLFIATRDAEILKEKYNKNIFANVNEVIDTNKEKYENIEKKNKPIELSENKAKAKYFDLKKFLIEVKKQQINSEISKFKDSINVKDILEKIDKDLARLEEIEKNN